MYFNNTSYIFVLNWWLEITIEHSFKEEVIYPTCTNNGYTLVTCEYCDYEEKKNEVALLDHEIEETEVLPTCKEEGYILSSCKNCEYSHKTPKGERLEHTYPEEDEWVVIEDNGCDEFAIFGKLCVKCQEVLETYEDLIPHDLKEVVVDPTCTERGYIQVVLDILNAKIVTMSLQKLITIKMVLIFMES